MPTYSYTCTKCGSQMEAFQKITDEPLISCPSCGQESLKKGVGGGFVAFRFQGSGFYQTDYKKGSSSSCCPCGKNKESCG